MTAFTLQASVPAIALAAGMSLRLEAVSPTTGLAVDGVNATEWAIYGANVSADVEAVTEIPAWVPDGEQEV